MGMGEQMMTPTRFRRGLSKPQQIPQHNLILRALDAVASVRAEAGGSVKIVIVSDIHANLAALQALPAAGFRSALVHRRPSSWTMGQDLMRPSNG